MKETIKQMLMSKRAEAVDFRTACNELGIKTTARQLSKWLRGKGIAYKMIIKKNTSICLHCNLAKLRDK